MFSRPKKVSEEIMIYLLNWVTTSMVWNVVLNWKLQWNKSMDETHQWGRRQQEGFLGSCWETLSEIWVPHPHSSLTFRLWRFFSLEFQILTLVNEKHCIPDKQVGWGWYHINTQRTVPSMEQSCIIKGDRCPSKKTWLLSNRVCNRWLTHGRGQWSAARPLGSVLKLYKDDPHVESMFQSMKVS